MTASHSIMYVIVWYHATGIRTQNLPAVHKVDSTTQYVGTRKVHKNILLTSTTTYTYTHNYLSLIH